MHPVAQIVSGLCAALVLSILVNWVYQVARKPSELFFPVSGTLYKSPLQTWRQYAAIFNRFSTRVISASFLAAMAQVEGAGNPVVRTYWRLTWTSQFFEIYRPASSAVGMYQMTDGTFAEAKRFCIRNHEVRQSCWFNSLYARVLPEDAVELTSAYLDWHVAHILERHHLSAATLQQKQDLAALIHLCGAGAGDTFAKRDFQVEESRRCGDHAPRIYLDRVNAAKREFARLAQIPF